MKRNWFLHVNAIYFNLIHKAKIQIVVNGSYKLIPLQLRDLGKCFNLGCHKEVMPYGVYTHQNVNMGACCIQGALDIIFEDDYKQQFLYNIEKWGCVLGKGMNSQMFDLIKHSSNYCKMNCNVLMDGYEVFRGWMLEHTKLDVYNFITIQPMASKFMLLSGCYGNVYQISGGITAIYY